MNKTLNKNPYLQAFASSAVGLIATGAYLVSSYFLDDKVGYNISNVIGLTIDHFVNFVLQNLIFVGHMKDIKKYIGKFMIANTISVCCSQILFIEIHKFTKIKYPDFYKNGWKKYISLIRYIVGFLVYPIAFLLRRDYVFV